MVEAFLEKPEVVPIEFQLPEKSQSRIELAPTQAVELRTSLKQLPIYAKGMIQVPDEIMASGFYHEEYDENPATVTHIKDFLPNFRELDWEKDIKPFLPSDEMFLDQHPYHLQSIHSKRHMARVIPYSRIRAEMLEFNESQKKVVAVAAGYHDTARENDRWDEGHGKRAADRFLSHIHIYESRGLQFNAEEVEAIQVLCQYHEIGWEKIPHEVKTKYGLLLEALTDGDKADRFRSPGRRWWTDPDMMSLSLTVDRKMLTKYINFTKYFTLSNEFERFENDWTMEEAFMKKCIATGIIKEPVKTSPGGILIFSLPESVEQGELIAA